MALEAARNLVRQRLSVDKLRVRSASIAAYRGLLASERPYPLYVAFVGVFIYFSVASPVFFSAANFLNIGRQTAFVSIIAIAMTFVIVAGEIDLSVGSTMSLSAMFAALAMQEVTNTWWMGLIAGLGTGLMVGLINGVIVATLRIPSFLVTLGMLFIASGLALRITFTQPVIIVNRTYDQYLGIELLGMPAGITWTIIVLVIAVPLLHFSTYGRRVYATGGNAIAARYSGIRTGRITVTVFMLTGVAAGLAAVHSTAVSRAARPDMGEALLLDVLAAVVLGGASLFGGRGWIIGTLIGSLLIGVLANGLVLTGVNPTIQLIVKGMIIIIAVAFTSRRRG